MAEHVTAVDVAGLLADLEAARMSPDGTLVAIRRGPNDWRVSNGGHYRDVHVADWLPLVPATEALRLARAGEALRTGVLGLAEELAANRPDDDDASEYDKGWCRGARFAADRLRGVVAAAEEGQ